jgi:glycosyltransferase involved in cell wall biosynthesis
MSQRPIVSLITNRSDYLPFGRLAEWLRRGFAEIGVRFDAVYLEGPRAVAEDGVTRAVRLGDHRSRGSIPALTRYLAEARPTIALATPGQIVPFAVFAGWLSRVRVVPWEQTILRLDLPSGTRAERVLYQLQRFGYGVPAIAVVSEDVALNFPSDRPRVYRLPNLVDIESLRELAGDVTDRRDSTSNSLHFCAVGRLAHQKGYDVLLRAFGHANPHLPESWRLSILGQGSLYSALKDQVRRERIAERVEFVGHLDNPYEFIAACDVFVHAARWEGFSVAMLEAAALGLAMVATDGLGGAKEILGEAGLLVPVDDSHALAQAIIEVANNERLRQALGQAAAERARAYGPRPTAERVLEIATEIGKPRSMLS